MRADARQALDRAKSLLAEDGLTPARYAALELRMAIEYIIYDRAKAYVEDIPPSEFGRWQPHQVMELLQQIEPNVDKGATLSVGLEETPGVEAKEFQLVAHEEVLSVRNVKRHYHALGNYLHAPTLKQHLAGKTQDQGELRKYCAEIVRDLDAILASHTWNLRFSYDLPGDPRTI